MSLFTLENNYVSLGCCFLLAWVSVINPVAAMCIIGPYRQRIKQIFGYKGATVRTTSGDYVVDSRTAKNASHISHLEVSKTIDLGETPGDETMEHF